MTIVWPWRSTSASGIDRLPLSAVENGRTFPQNLGACASNSGLHTDHLRGTTVRTPICDRLGIELPIFAFSHCRDVVAAVSKAGGYGVLGALPYAPDQLEIELSWIDEH